MSDERDAKPSRVTPKVTAKLGRCLTLPKAAAYLGLTANELAGRVRRGLITYHRDRPRTRYHFYEQELDAYLESTRIAPTVPRQAPARCSIAHLMPAVRQFA